MFYTPYESGVILFKDKSRHSLITEDFIKNAGYLEDETVRKSGNQMERGRSYGNSRPSGSMGSGPAISTWATMKLFGNIGIRTILNHTLELTDQAYQRAERSDVLKPLHKPELNTLLVSLQDSIFLSKDANNQLINNAIKYAARRGYYISSDDEITHGRKILRFLAMRISDKRGFKNMIKIKYRLVKLAQAVYNYQQEITK
jgi:glutamate/tyrosine decarboxylase-like PLP-dependent enzyme